MRKTIDSPCPDDVRAASVINDPIPYELTDEGLAALVEPWHWIKKTDILEAVISGEPMTALCGADLGDDALGPQGAEIVTWRTNLRRVRLNASPDRPGRRAMSAAYECPSWCVSASHGRPCSGEHDGEMTYTPATGGRPEAVDISGASFTTVGVGVRWSELDDGQHEPAVALHISGRHKDTDVDLRPHETRRVAALLVEAADLLEGGSR